LLLFGETNLEMR